MTVGLEICEQQFEDVMPLEGKSKNIQCRRRKRVRKDTKSVIFLSMYQNVLATVLFKI